MPADLWPPDLLPGADEWLAAFTELSTDRHVGEAIGPIPSSAIRAWSAGWPDQEQERFRACIRAMDRAFLDFHMQAADGKPAPEMAPEAFDAMFG